VTTEKEELGSLQHLCRLKIVLPLIRKGHYSGKTVDSLPVPPLLKRYLEYDGHSWSKDFLEYCEAVEEGEVTINKLLDKLDPDGVIPRSVQSVKYDCDCAAR